MMSSFWDCLTRALGVILLSEKRIGSEDKVSPCNECQRIPEINESATVQLKKQHVIPVWWYHPNDELCLECCARCLRNEASAPSVNKQYVKRYCEMCVEGVFQTRVSAWDSSILLYNMPLSVIVDTIADMNCTQSEVDLIAKQLKMNAKELLFLQKAWLLSTLISSASTCYEKGDLIVKMLEKNVTYDEIWELILFLGRQFVAISIHFSALENITYIKKIRNLNMKDKLKTALLRDLFARVPPFDSFDTSNIELAQHLFLFACDSVRKQMCDLLVKDAIKKEKEVLEAIANEILNYGNKACWETFLAACEKMGGSTASIPKRYEARAKALFEDKLSATTVTDRVRLSDLEGINMDDGVIIDREESYDLCSWRSLLDKYWEMELYQYVLEKRTSKKEV